MKFSGQYSITDPKPQGLVLWRLVAALVLLPGLLWGLAWYLSTGIYEARQTAIKITAIVEDIETKSRVTFRDHQGRPTEYQDRQHVKISFQMDDALRQGALLDSYFDPESSWLQYADFDRKKYPAGSQVDVLVRPDLGYAATNASIVDSYYLPILIASLGGFIFLILGVGTLLIALGNRRSV